jgi:cob(I)alamin adenosyltransferase
VRIYTGVGDEGETALFDGSHVSKSEARVDAYGEVDELNATLGVALAAGLDDDLCEMVTHLQRDLFALGAHLADPRPGVADRVPKATFGRVDVERLEGWIDGLEEALPPLTQFILPGGGPAGAALHHARTVCRRAERRIVAFGQATVDGEILRYVNRLSDLLFVLARTANHRRRVPEVEW